MVGGDPAGGNLLLDLSRRPPAQARVAARRRLRDPRHSAKLMLALGTIYLVWGSSFLFTKLAVANLPPALFSGIRFVTAVVLPAPISLHWGGTASPPRVIS